MKTRIRFETAEEWQIKRVAIFIAELTRQGICHDVETAIDHMTIIITGGY